jgi:hypothetical protein
MADCALRNPRAYPDDSLDRRTWVRVGRGMRSCGATIPPLPPLVRKPLLPFAEPGAGTRDARQNFRRGFFLVKERESEPTIPNFFRIFLLHPPTLKAVLDEDKIQY